MTEGCNAKDLWDDFYRASGPIDFIDDSIEMFDTDAMIDAAHALFEYAERLERDRLTPVDSASNPQETRMTEDRK